MVSLFFTRKEFDGIVKVDYNTVNSYVQGFMECISALGENSKMHLALNFPKSSVKEWEAERDDSNHDAEKPFCKPAFSTQKDVNKQGLPDDEKDAPVDIQDIGTIMPEL